MSWPDLVEGVHQACLAAFGEDGVFWTPQGSPPGTLISIEAFTEKMAIEEPFAPGSSTGTTNLPLWIDTGSLSPAPVMGDEIVINGVSYDVANVTADIEGGAILKLKRNS